MTVVEVDPDARAAALSAVAASEAACRLAQAFGVLDTIAIVRRNLTVNDLSDAAEGVWRVFADLAMPSLPLTQQALVFARVLPLVASTRIVPLAAEVWPESFDLDLGSVKLSWDASERVVVFDDRFYSIVVTESGAIGGRVVVPKQNPLAVPRPKQAALIAYFQCQCGEGMELREGASSLEHAGFHAFKASHTSCKSGAAA